MNWGPVKVINDDILQPGHTVPHHQHKNYDILGYLVDGELEHCDSLGNTVRATSPQVQHMWCGRSIWHTEQCVSTRPARYLQIWITPPSGYEQTPPQYRLVERDINYSPLPIMLKNTELSISAGVINGTHTFTLDSAYMYVVSGTVVCGDTTLGEGDGAEFRNYTLTAHYDAHIILFKR